MFGQQRLWGVTDPVGNTECAEFREVAVIENQNEMCQLIAETFEHVSVAAWKVPDVSRCKFVRFSFPRGVDHRGAHSAFGDERPFGSVRMPMKFAHQPVLE